MFDLRNDAVRKYLLELDTELKQQGVAAASDARNDAREFLQGELLTLQEAGVEPSSRELYTRFVKQFGSPRVVAQGYAEPADTCSRQRTHACAGRIHWKVAAAALLILAGTVGICLAGLHEPPKLSPFTEVRYEEDESVVVRFRGELYRLEVLDGIPAKSILQSARDQFGDLWQKRFAEDLIEVLWGMGHRPGKTVRLELHDTKSDKVIKINDAAMTHANRQQIYRARNDGRWTAGLREPPKRSPFTEVRYEEDESVIVRFRGELYQLRAIDGIPVKSILQSARDQFGDRWQKRFAEDLVEVLWGMDHRPGKTVRLELHDAKADQVLKINDAAMTEENRWQVWDARNRRNERKEQKQESDD